MSYISILVRIFLAVLFGGIIGLERERKGRAAGLRTHMLVCMGACLIMLVSMRMYEIYDESQVVDPGRIAAAVVTGIGFLGAGTIIRSAQQVKGLTTAATIWISSAIGLGVGCGFYFPAFLVTLSSLAILLLLRRLEFHIESKGSKSKK